MNFDRLRLVSELADIGALREAMLATSIPESPGAFLRFIDTALADTSQEVTEFKYRCSLVHAIFLLLIHRQHIYRLVLFLCQGVSTSTLSQARCDSLSCCVCVIQGSNLTFITAHIAASRNFWLRKHCSLCCRYSAGEVAHILFSVGIKNAAELSSLMQRLNDEGMKTLDLSAIEAAQVSVGLCHTTYVTPCYNLSNPSTACHSLSHNLSV